MRHFLADLQLQFPRPRRLCLGTRALPSKVAMVVPAPVENTFFLLILHDLTGGLAEVETDPMI